MRQGRQQQEPAEASQGRLNAAPERCRSLRPSGRGGCQDAADAIDAIGVAEQTFLVLAKWAEEAGVKIPDATFLLIRNAKSD